MSDVYTVLAYSDTVPERQDKNKLEARRTATLPPPQLGFCASHLFSPVCFFEVGTLPSHVPCLWEFGREKRAPSISHFARRWYEHCFAQGLVGCGPCWWLEVSRVASPVHRCWVPWCLKLMSRHLTRFANWKTLVKCFNSCCFCCFTLPRSACKLALSRSPSKL